MTTSPSMSFECAYRTLGLQDGASREEIEATYIKLVKSSHPDRRTGNLGDFLNIEQAYKKLVSSTSSTAPVTAPLFNDSTKTVHVNQDDTVPHLTINLLKKIALQMLDHTLKSYIRDDNGETDVDNGGEKHDKKNSDNDILDHALESLKRPKKRSITVVRHRVTPLQMWQCKKITVTYYRITPSLSKRAEDLERCSIDIELPILSKNFPDMGNYHGTGYEDLRVDVTVEKDPYYSFCQHESEIAMYIACKLTLEEFMNGNTLSVQLPDQNNCSIFEMPKRLYHYGTKIRLPKTIHKHIAHFAKLEVVGIEK
jgi:hypothetical protein